MVATLTLTCAADAAEGEDVMFVVAVKAGVDDEACVAVDVTTVIVGVGDSFPVTGIPACEVEVGTAARVCAIAVPTAFGSTVGTV